MSMIYGGVLERYPRDPRGARRGRHRLDPVHPLAHGRRVGGPVQGPLADDAAQRVLAAAVLRDLPDGPGRPQAPRRAGRRQHHVGLGLPASRRHLARLARVHRARRWRTCPRTCGARSSARTPRVSTTSRHDSYTRRLTLPSPPRRGEGPRSLVAHSLSFLGRGTSFARVGSPPHWGEGRVRGRMKILFVPNLIVSALSEADRANILEAAGPGARIVQAKDSASQRRELPDTDIIFGRVHADNFPPRQAPHVLPLDRRGRRQYPHARAGEQRRAAGQREGRRRHPPGRARLRAPPGPHARAAHRDPHAGLRAARADPRPPARALRADHGHRGLRGHRPRRGEARRGLRHAGARRGHRGRRARAGRGGHLEARPPAPISWAPPTWW